MRKSYPIAVKDGYIHDVQAYFGLSQTELAYLLGVAQPQVAAAATLSRSLPGDALYRLRALYVLLSAPLAPEPALSPAEAALLQARHAACLDQARRLRYRLAHELPARAAPAHRRLAHAVTLPAALAATEEDAPLPPRTREDQQSQLRQLHNQALDELEDRSGPGQQALLRARLAGLLAEAAALEQELAGATPP